MLHICLRLCRSRRWCAHGLASGGLHGAAVGGLALDRAGGSWPSTSWETSRAPSARGVTSPPADPLEYPASTQRNPNKVINHGSSRWRSGSAHWDLELAEDMLGWQCLRPAVAMICMLCFVWPRVNLCLTVEWLQEAYGTCCWPNSISKNECTQHGPTLAQCGPFQAFFFAL